MIRYGNVCERIIIKTHINYLKLNFILFKIFDKFFRKIYIFLHFYLIIFFTITSKKNIYMKYKLNENTRSVLI